MGSKNILMSANINSIVIFSQVLHNLSMWTAKEKSLNYDQAKEEAAKAQKDIKMVISLSSTADKLVILSVWYNIPSRNLRSVPKRCSIVWSVICAQSSRQEIKKCYMFNVPLPTNPLTRHPSSMEWPTWLGSSSEIHDLRSTIHDSRLTTHDSRLTTHDSRLTIQKKIRQVKKKKTMEQEVYFRIVFIVFWPYTVKIIYKKASTSYITLKDSSPIWQIHT